jgi:hypothetical protein
MSQERLERVGVCSFPVCLIIKGKLTNIIHLVHFVSGLLMIYMFFI